MIRPTAAGIEFDIRAIPRAKRTELAGERDGALVLRVNAPPVEGAANDAVIAFFAAALGVPRRSVRIVGGTRSRQKRIAVDGVTPEQLRALK